jgi:hypothetical protein
LNKYSREHDIINNKLVNFDDLKQKIREHYKNPRSHAPMDSKEFHEWAIEDYKIRGEYGLWNKILFSEPSRISGIFFDKVFDGISFIGGFPTNPFDIIEDQIIENGATPEEMVEILFWRDIYEEMINSYRPK